MKPRYNELIEMRRFSSAPFFSVQIISKLRQVIQKIVQYELSTMISVYLVKIGTMSQAVVRRKVFLALTRHARDRLLAIIAHTMYESSMHEEGAAIRASTQLLKNTKLRPSNLFQRSPGLTFYRANHSSGSAAEASDACILEQEVITTRSGIR